jgi:hypothetical protein
VLTAFVLACGYRQVSIPKSGNSFPAWLIAFRKHTVVGESADASHGVVCFWRSKRDFLRLARALKSLPDTTTLYPKAAMQQLAAKAPWMRTEAVDALSRQVNDEAKPTNCWHPSLTKNVWKVNSFLQVAAVTAESSSMTEWDHFCRPVDTENVVEIAGNALACREHTKLGQELGQYFCTPANAQQLVDCLVRRVAQLCRRCDRLNSRRLVLVEPSCGHGQVVWTLLHVLQTMKQEYEADPEHCTNVFAFFGDVEIRGYDIDPVAIQQCQETARGRDTCISTCFEVADFLATRRDSIAHRPGIETWTVVIGGPPYSSRSNSAVSSISGHPVRTGAICLDCPQRFVQHAALEWEAMMVTFLMPRRCRRMQLDDYKQASPPSAGKCPLGQTRQVKEAGRNENNATWPSEADTWKMEAHDLIDGSTFYFQGQLDGTVTQPSIIQEFWRSGMNEQSPEA